MFGNFVFFNTIDAYIKKNLALLRLSRPYVETKIEAEIFSKTLYMDKDGKKKFLVPAAFFYINENVVEELPSFQIPNPHFCTKAALYHGDFEADLLIPFFNSKNLGEAVTLLIQKEVFYLGKEKINIFINQGKDTAEVSYYSLFMFLVNLYCFDEEPLKEIREAFETFLASKDFTELFGYFVVAFKAKVAEIKPFFEELYAKRYIDCNYSEAIINSNKKIALKVNISYSDQVSLNYQMKIPAGEVLTARASAVPIEFLLTKTGAEEVFEKGINNIIPYSVKFIGRNSPPIFKYAKRFFEGSYIDASESELSFGLNYKREKMQAVFYRNLNSRAFANQIKAYNNMTEDFVRNNIAAIEARKFIAEISGSLLKNVLLIASLS